MLWSPLPTGCVTAMAVWFYYRFPLSLRMVEKMLAARGVEVDNAAKAAKAAIDGAVQALVASQ